MGFWDMGYGTWDRDVENSHDRMFDMNGDGVLDTFEQILHNLLILISPILLNVELYTTSIMTS